MRGLHLSTCGKSLRSCVEHSTTVAQVKVIQLIQHLPSNLIDWVFFFVGSHSIRMGVLGIPHSRTAHHAYKLRDSA